MVASRENARWVCWRWRNRGLKISMTNGCFDVLHDGHRELLSACRGFGDKVVVALNDDESVRRLKGETRPKNPQEARAQALEPLCDLVVLFREDIPLEVVCEVRPDVLVKGGDWEGLVSGQKTVESWGGKIIVVPRVNGQSTTFLLERSR